MPRATRKSALNRGRQVRWPINPEQFSRQRRAALLSPKACSDVLGVSERTIRNWEKGRAAIPYSAFKLLRILTGGELPGTEWQGFWIKGGELWTPEGKRYDAAELAYVSNVFAMARYWLRDYHAQSALLQQARLLGKFVDRQIDPGTQSPLLKVIV